MLTIHTAAYRRTHGQPPWHVQGKGMWAFTVDAQPQVLVKYGTYPEALTWAREQAQRTVTVLP